MLYLYGFCEEGFKAREHNKVVPSSPLCLQHIAFWTVLTTELVAITAIITAAHAAGEYI